MLVWTGDRIYLEMTINAILVHVVINECMW